MPKLSKVARGIAYGDVSNSAIRNILTEISISKKGRFTEEDMIETLDFFGWRCPYTGKDLSFLKTSNNFKDCATDHIYPQNKIWCGLNVKGNLVIVDKAANSKKASKSVEDFLLHDTKVITDIDLIGRTRQERLDLIEEFQKKCGYDPYKIKNILSPLLIKKYDEVRQQQEKAINNALAELSNNNISLISPKVITKTTASSSSQKVSTTLIFNPSDQKVFVDEFLNKKVARFVLTYDTGAIRESVWKCGNFDRSSNLRTNVQSRPFWRNRRKEGLVKVEVIVD